MSPSTRYAHPFLVAALTGALLLWSFGSGAEAPPPASSGLTKTVDLTNVTPSIGLAQLDYLTEEWAPFNYKRKEVAAGISADILEAVF